MFNQWGFIHFNMGRPAAGKGHALDIIRGLRARDTDACNMGETDS